MRASWQSGNTLENHATHLLESAYSLLPLCAVLCGGWRSQVHHLDSRPGPADCGYPAHLGEEGEGEEDEMLGEEEEMLGEGRTCSHAYVHVDICRPAASKSSLVARPSLAAFFAAVEKMCSCNKSCEGRPGYEATQSLLCTLASEVYQVS